MWGEGERVSGNSRLKAVGEDIVWMMGRWGLLIICDASYSCSIWSVRVSSIFPVPMCSRC